MAISDTLLVIGGRWAEGRTAGYVHGQSKKEWSQLNNNPDSCRHLHWGELLGIKHNLHVDYIAESDQTNEEAFLRVTEYLQRPHNLVGVIWEVQPIYLKRIYSSKTDFRKSCSPYFPEHIKDHIRSHKIDFDYYFDNYIDPAWERTCLQMAIAHWDEYFKLKGIPNYWFDSLYDCIHPCPRGIRKCLLQELTWVCSTDYELNGDWHLCYRDRKDYPQLDHAVTVGLVDPFFHSPTKEGNRRIALIMEHVYKDIFHNPYNYISYPHLRA